MFLYPVQCRVVFTPGVLPVTSTANTLNIAGDVHIRTPKQPKRVLEPGTRPVRRIGTAEDRQPRDRRKGLPIPALEPNNPNNHGGCFTIHSKCPLCMPIDNLATTLGDAASRDQGTKAATRLA